MFEKQKYAVRIVDSNWHDAEHKLFAIVKREKVDKYRELAKKSLPLGSASYVAVEYWN